MKPYYEQDGITIYLGDCREILPSIRDACEVVVADPPYGIDLDTSGGRPGGTVYPKIYGDDEPFDPAHLLALDLPTVLWGANHYANKLPESRGWIAWDKVTRNDIDQKQAEMELAWTNFLPRPRVFRHMWMGGYRASERGELYHPTQKPIALMAWLLNLIPKGTVVDPYMGSGPVLVAAKAMGRTAIGIEMSERYCEVAARRLAQGVLFGVGA